MEKNMNVKQEIMEKELDKVAGGKVSVTKVLDTVTKVVDTVKKVMPNKTNDGGSDKQDAAPANGAGGTGADGVFKQTFQKNTKLNNQLSVNGDNNAGNLKF